MKGKPVVKYQSSDVMIGINRWKSVAIGYFQGINPSFGAIEHFAKIDGRSLDLRNVSSCHLEFSCSNSRVMKVEML
ncbi:hypothetical protein LIER_25001 [Lithospermum erythrorhizon]|uniref:Uncharacterized protein n=1 Tax=Lithospermum erythrorhizon TaxID=34254 RepID=A0AAV3R4L1_LITER